MELPKKKGKPILAFLDDDNNDKNEEQDDLEGEDDLFSGLDKNED
jgi:hypothetical protein